MKENQNISHRRICRWLRAMFPRRGCSVRCRHYIGSNLEHTCIGCRRTTRVCIPVLIDTIINICCLLDRLAVSSSVTSPSATTYTTQQDPTISFLKHCQHYCLFWHLDFFANSSICNPICSLFFNIIWYSLCSNYCVVLQNELHKLIFFLKKN